MQQFKHLKQLNTSILFSESSLIFAHSAFAESPEAVNPKTTDAVTQANMTGLRDVIVVDNN